MKEISKSFLQLIYLIGCALNSKTPDKRIVAEVDWPSLKRNSEFHRVTATVAMGLSPLLSDRELFSEKEAAFWRLQINNAVRRATLLTGECRELGRMMDAAGIWHMTLKGLLIQNDYPRFGMREMVDVDMLFDQTKAEELRDLMVARGYTVTSYALSHHDIYEKPPVYEFEMHRTLMNHRYPLLYDYYEDIFPRLQKKDDDTLEYRFTPEDFYIFLVAHDCKHLHNSGIGVRQLADLYVITKKETFDRAYVDAELKKLRVADDERMLVHLAHMVYAEDFDPDTLSLTDEEAELMLFLLKSGSHGTHENKVKNILENRDAVFYENGGSAGKHKKLTYIKKRVLIPPEEYQHDHPFAYRHKWARPAFFAARLAKVVATKPKSVLGELKIIKRS